MLLEAENDVEFNGTGIDPVMEDDEEDEEDEDEEEEEE